VVGVGAEAIWRRPHPVYQCKVYSEVSFGFERIEELESALSDAGFEFLRISKEALFLAGKAFIRYRKRGGRKDFSIT
jgi:hypothetical protein